MIFGPVQFIRNKYYRCYIEIVERGQTSRENLGYTEKHHVYPKCFGGSNSKTNLTILTLQEHFICHWLLTKFTIGRAKSKMANALWCMMPDIKGNLRNNFVKNSWRYQTIRAEYLKYAQSDEYRAFISKTNKGRNLGVKRPQSFCDAISARMKNRIKTIEHKANIAAGWQASRIRMICEYCGKDNLIKSMHTRWHGPRCKESPTYDPSIHDSFKQFMRELRESEIISGKRKRGTRKKIKS
jgi:hypothetical protein